MAIFVNKKGKENKTKNIYEAKRTGQNKKGERKVEIKSEREREREREKQADSTNSRYVLTSTKGAYEQLFFKKKFYTSFVFFIVLCHFFSFISIFIFFFFHLSYFLLYRTLVEKL